MTFNKIQTSFQFRCKQLETRYDASYVEENNSLFFYKILISCGKGSMENEYGAVGCKLNLKEET